MQIPRRELWSLAKWGLLATVVTAEACGLRWFDFLLAPFWFAFWFWLPFVPFLVMPVAVAYFDHAPTEHPTLQETWRSPRKIELPTWMGQGPCRSGSAGSA